MTPNSTLVIVIAALNGFQSVANRFIISINRIYNVFAIINIIIEVMFYMLFAYKFPLILVIGTIITRFNIK